MTYQVTLIVQHEVSLVRKCLDLAYAVMDPVAGSWTAQAVGGSTILVFCRDAGDDAGVLEMYGENLDARTAVRQLQREVKAVIHDLESEADPSLFSILKEICQDLTGGQFSVLGIDAAPPSRRMVSAIPVTGEKGERCYVAIAHGELQLIVADSLEDAHNLTDSDEVQMHFIGYTSEAYK